MNLIVFRDDVTIKIDSRENAVGFTVGARDYKGVQCVMVEENNGKQLVCGQRSDARLQTSKYGGRSELYARSADNIA